MTSTLRKSTSSTMESHYVTSPSPMTTHGRDRLSRVTHIPDVCRHNVYSRCAVAPPRRVIGTSLSCDFSTCSKGASRGQDPDTLGARSCDGLGDVYYDRMCELIDRQLELGTGDRLCYVGDGRAGRAIVSILTERYCIVPRAVIVDTSDTATADNTTTLTELNRPFKRPSPQFRRFEDVFALRYSTSRDEPRFDKIVVVDALCHIVSAAERSTEVGNSNHLSTTVLQLMKSLADYGRLMVVHRPAGLNTLPLPSTVLERYINDTGDIPLAEIVSAVESMGLVLRWSVERVPIVTTRRRWIELIDAGFPRTTAFATSSSTATDDGVTADPPSPDDREVAGRDSRQQVVTTEIDAFPQPIVVSSSQGARLNGGSGIGELMGGILRYSGEETPVEFFDRLAFVSVTRFNQTTSAIGVRQRQRGSLPAKIKSIAIGGLMDIEAESELGRYVEAMRVKKDNKPNLFM